MDVADFGRSDLCERPQNRERDHPPPSLPETTRLNEVKPPQTPKPLRYKTPSSCLRVERRVPVHVEDDDAIRRLEVQTRAAGLRRNVGQEDLRVRVKPVHIFLSLRTCCGTVYSNRIGVDGLERAFEDVQRLCGSREDQHFCWG